MKFTLPLTYTVRMRRARTQNDFKNRVFGEWVVGDVAEPSDTEAPVSASWKMANGKTIDVLTYEDENYSPLMPVEGREAHFEDYGQEVTKYFKNAFDYQAVKRLSANKLQPYEPDHKHEVSDTQDRHTNLDKRRKGIENILDSLIFVRGHFYSKCEDPFIQFAPKHGGLTEPFQTTITAKTKFWPYNRFDLHAWSLTDHEKIADHYREWYGREIDLSKRNIEVLDPAAFKTDLELKLLFRAVDRTFKILGESTIELMALEAANKDLAARCNAAVPQFHLNSAWSHNFRSDTVDFADDIPDLAADLLELFETKVGPINQLLGGNSLPADPMSLKPFYTLVDLAATKARYDARPLRLDDAFVAGTPGL